MEPTLTPFLLFEQTILKKFIRGSKKINFFIKIPNELRPNYHRHPHLPIKVLINQQLVPLIL